MAGRRMLTPAEAMQMLLGGKQGAIRPGRVPCLPPACAVPTVPSAPVPAPTAAPAGPVPVPAPAAPAGPVLVPTAAAAAPAGPVLVPTAAAAAPAVTPKVIRDGFVRRLTATRLARLASVTLDSSKPVLVGLPEDIDFAATIAAVCQRLYASSKRKAHIIYASDLVMGQLGREVALTQRRTDLDGSIYVPVLVHMWSFGATLSQMTEAAGLPGPLLLVVDDMYDPLCAGLRRAVSQHLFLQPARPRDVPDAEGIMSQYLQVAAPQRKWMRQLVASAPTAMFVESQLAFGACVESMSTDPHPGRVQVLTDVVTAKKCAAPLHRDDASRLTYDLHGTYVTALNNRHKADQLGTCSQVLDMLMAVDTLGTEMFELPEVAEMLANSSCLFRRYEPKETDMYYACINHLKKSTATPCLQDHGSESLALDAWRSPCLLPDESKKLHGQLSKQCKYWAFSNKTGSKQ